MHRTLRIISPVLDIYQGLDLQTTFVVFERLIPRDKALYCRTQICISYSLFPSPLTHLVEMGQTSDAISRGQSQCFKRVGGCVATVAGGTWTSMCRSSGMTCFSGVFVSSPLMPGLSHAFKTDFQDPHYCMLTRQGVRERTHRSCITAKSLTME